MSVARWRERMRKVLLPTILVGAVTFGAAAEPYRLTGSQLDSVTAGQLEEFVEFIATETTGVLTDPDFQGAVQFLDPNDFALVQIKSQLIPALKLIPQAALAQAPDPTPDDDGSAFVSEVEVTSQETISSSGGVFDLVRPASGQGLVGSTLRFFDGDVGRTGTTSVAPTIAVACPACSAQ